MVKLIKMKVKSASNQVLVYPGLLAAPGTQPCPSPCRAWRILFINHIARIALNVLEKSSRV